MDCTNNNALMAALSYVLPRSELGFDTRLKLPKYTLISWLEQGISVMQLRSNMSIWRSQESKIDKKRKQSQMILVPEKLKHPYIRIIVVRTERFENWARDQGSSISRSLHMIVTSTVYLHSFKSLVLHVGLEAPIVYVGPEALNSVY